VVSINAMIRFAASPDTASAWSTIYSQTQSRRSDERILVIPAALSSSSNVSFSIPGCVFWKLSLTQRECLTFREKMGQSPGIFRHLSRRVATPPLGDGKRPISPLWSAGPS
jgi:hypothetical protein